MCTWVLVICMFWVACCSVYYSGISNMDLWSCYCYRWRVESPSIFVSIVYCPLTVGAMPYVRQNLQEYIMWYCICYVRCDVYVYWSRLMRGRLRTAKGNKGCGCVTHSSSSSSAGGIASPNIGLDTDIYDARPREYRWSRRRFHDFDADWIGYGKLALRV